MARRLIIDRLAEGSSAPELGEAIPAPELAAIHLVFGVGRRPGQAPTGAEFSPVYTVEIPVFSLTGLDSDGVYEFDAARTLQDLQARAQRRAWAMRLELTFVQAPATVHACDVYVQTPYPTGDGGPKLEVAGAGARGTTTLGGARELVLASSLAHDAEQVAALGGEFEVIVADGDPNDENSRCSAARNVALNLTRYEFQG